LLPLAQPQHQRRRQHIARVLQDLDNVDEEPQPQPGLTPMQL
jgi:hypothetical protein